MANKTSEKKTEVQTTAKGKAAQKVKNSSANLTRKVQKEPVKIREQVLSNGTRSLYLDIIYHGKRKREFLKAYLVDAKIPAERRQNAQAMAFAEAVKGKRLIELQTKEYSFTKQYEEDTPFLTYFRKLCEERFKKKDSKGNWGNWHSCLKHLENYCDEKTTFKDIDREWILGFKEYLENVEKDTGKKTRNKNNNLFVGLSQNSKVSYFGKLRACINQAFNERIIPTNPLVGVEGFKTEEVVREFLTIDELRKLKNTPCKYPWLRAAFLFSCITGLRVSDVQKLTWGELHKIQAWDRIVFKQKKTGGMEYLDINRQAYELLGEPGEPNDKVFHGFSYSSETLLELRRWILAAGITKDITYHCSRHTFAIMMLNIGVDIYTVSKLLGHRFLATTQIYARVLDKSKQEAISKIPQL